MRNLMNKALEKVGGGFAWLVYGAFYLLMLAIIFAPVIIIELPGFWGYILRFGVLLFFFLLPDFSPLLMLVLWFVSIPFAIKLPICPVLVYYLISAAIYVIFEFIPSLGRLIALINEH